MKKIVKRILWGTGLVILLFVLLVGGFFLKMKSEMKKINAIETKEVVPNIYSIKDSFVNMFLVKDSDNYVAIDAGSNMNAIAVQLKNLNINPEKVTAVFLTHSDADHTAALLLFKNAKIYFSRQEVPMIDGTTSKMFFFHNTLSRKDYTLLEDQQELTVGTTHIKGILTPGHTPGSTSYLVNDKYLFVGDAFGLKDGKISKPSAFFSKDMKMAIKSFQKIKNLPQATYIFTAHNGYSSDYKNAIDVNLE
jgi:glyoxylase-like metal-dependent hydrolase (beta-lactamase superfamily II)